jgi:alkylation response protein AidB-like acyl-CoA dehydrogenase
VPSDATTARAAEHGGAENGGAGRLPVGRASSAAEVLTAVRDWVDRNVPPKWRRAAAEGGPAAVRRVRTRADYEAWYPVFGRSGLVVPTWPVEYGGLDVTTAAAQVIDAELRPLNLGRLNPLGLNQAAYALFAHGSHEQRLRFLPPIVRNEEIWCQLFSEPGAGSDLASLATCAEADGDGWFLTGQKIWNTWAHRADWAVALARTDPGVPKRQGLTYFLLDMHQPGVEVVPLPHMGGEIEFNRVTLRQAWAPDGQRVGDVGDGWRVAGATLSGERQMVAGAGSGGVDRIGGLGVSHLVDLARRSGRSADPLVRDRLVRLWTEERVREWTNRRVRAELGAGRTPGAASSVGKVHHADLNQRVQLLATDLLGLGAVAWESAETGYAAGMPLEVRGMLKSRANTIEGGTSEVNQNIVGERVLGLPREPDPWKDMPWNDVPRS